MTTLLLVRHATTAATGSRLGGWTPGVHLDDAGREQARATGELLRDHDVRAVYASPLERTQDTAEIIADLVGQEVRTREGLGETDYGDWTDRPLAELRKEPLWKVIQSSPSRVTFPGGESLRGTQHRMVEQLEELTLDHDDRDLVVAVSHADPIKAALAYFLGMSLDAFQRIVISPASISVVMLSRGHAPIVGAVNQRTSLDLPSAPAPDDVDADPDADAEQSDAPTTTDRYPSDDDEGPRQP